MGIQQQILEWPAPNCSVVYRDGCRERERMCVTLRYYILRLNRVVFSLISMHLDPKFEIRQIVWCCPEPGNLKLFRYDCTAGHSQETK